MTETAPKKKYRLIYFNLMGQVEPVRLLFALAKVPYEDYRIPENEWPNEKPSRSNFTKETFSKIVKKLVS